MIEREKLIKHIEQFPAKLSIDELIDRLVFVEKLEQRLQQSAVDNTISEKELENEMKQWFK